MNVAPKALSLDLDDTLWPIWPVIQRAEAALDAFLREHCPRTAERYPIALMRDLRERIAADHPQHAHDFTKQRKLSLAHALRSSGDDEMHVEAAFRRSIRRATASSSIPMRWPRWIGWPRAGRSPR